MQDDKKFYHEPIMVDACVAALNIKRDGVYVDCTFGGGGHSKKILEALSAKGSLYAFDQDEAAQANLIEDERFNFLPHNFCYIKNFLNWKGVNKVDGIFADLGVSSYQIDTPERGFSLRFEKEKLDMRMDLRADKNAIEILNTYTQEALANVFFNYGELLNSRQLATLIVEQRKNKKIESLEDFKKVAAQQIKGMEHKYLTKVLQALRIEVNGELEVLKKLLLQTNDLLKPAGRLVVISFHSLEDRIVKRHMKNEDWETGVRHEAKTFEMLSKKPIEADRQEVKKNSRSKSAKLRFAEKII